MSYENPWTFDGEEFDSENIGNSYGFVYIITTPKGQKYVGRKYFWSVRKVKGKTRRQRSESDWKSYYGSSEVLKEEIKQSDKPLFKREIISLHSTKGRVNFEEVREQFAHEVLERDDYINDNINGKWHRSPEHIRSKSRFSALASRRASKQDT
jgi:hypothetical protein